MIKHLSLLCLIGVLSLEVASFGATPITPAVGYNTLPYDLPEVGSYTLPSIQVAADGEVIDRKAQPSQLHDIYDADDKYTLLGFIYSNCGDVNGCPLSSYVFYKLKSEMQRDPVLASRLRLLSLSFDPERDTPEIMDLYGKNFDYAGPKGEWRFLTTDSEETLIPLLTDYKQDIQREMTVNGEPGTQISHVLRVFLIDPERNIRNIYSVEFLHPDIVVNDLKTLIQQEDSAPSNKPKLIYANNKTVEIDSDSNSGSNARYEALQQQAIQLRKGKQTDLLALANNPPIGLPALPNEVLNNLTPKKIALGKKLFFDRRLSLNNTMSCAMCHVPEQGFTSNEIATAVGLEGRSVRRNTPSLYNVAYAKTLFHDSREDSLIQQVWAPFLARNEMANPSVAAVVNKLRGLKDYQNTFEAVFDKKAGMENIGDALAAYQQTLLSADSAFDRWHFGKQSAEKAGVSDDAQAGFKLFTGKARCATCHTIAADNALFTDHGLHNTGLGYQRSMGIKPATKSVELAPGVFVDVDQSIIDSVSEKPAADLGHYEISQNPDDRWKYKTPSLRNLALTAPYMHDGSMRSLHEVVEFYNQGGITNPNLDPLIQPLGLNDTETAQLVAFMQSLTGSNVSELVEDAFAAPVGDVTKKIIKPEVTEIPAKKATIEMHVGGDFTLTDHHGNPFHLKQLRGKLTLIFFGYTHCPDVCPTELASLGRILKQLPPEDADKIQGLFITVDPERDTAKVLSQFVPYFHADLIGLTGTTTAIKSVMQAYRVHTSIDKTKRKDKHYFVDHSANLYIVDDTGTLAQIVPFGFPENHILDIVKTRLAALPHH